jgi:hypothetical protein
MGVDGVFIKAPFELQRNDRSMLRREAEGSLKLRDCWAGTMAPGEIALASAHDAVHNCTPAAADRELSIPPGKHECSTRQAPLPANNQAHCA